MLALNVFIRACTPSLHDQTLVVLAGCKRKSSQGMVQSMNYDWQVDTLGGSYTRATLLAKMGFTVLGQKADGQPDHVRGERGSLERNAMRSYLCLIASLCARTGSLQEQLDARQRAWFALTERYANQLHELDLQDYLDEKHSDLFTLSIGK